MKKTRQASILKAAFVLAFAVSPSWGAERVALPKKGEPAAAPASSDASPSGPATDSAEAAERVNVDAIKEKYWARGDESELGVVQNRLYSKSGRVEVGIFGGLLSSDPFLNTRALGLSAGYHFNEYFALHAFGWKASVGPSAALRTLEEGGKKANINPQKSFMGAEGSASLLYGKLSVLGKAIIYYDFHILAGAGRMDTESGSALAAHVGVGQQVYLNKNFTFRVDYRHMRYTEQIREKEIITKLGNETPRTNYTGAVTLGVSFLFGN